VGSADLGGGAWGDFVLDVSVLGRGGVLRSLFARLVVSQFAIGEECG
jgi:hypothetical protein